MSNKQASIQRFGAFAQPPPEERDTYTRTIIFHIPTLTTKKTGKLNRAMKEYRYARSEACQYFQNHDPFDFTISDQSELSGQITDRGDIQIPRLQVGYAIRIVNQNYREFRKETNASPPEANRADTLAVPRKYTHIFHDDGCFYLNIRTGRGRVALPLETSEESYHTDYLPSPEAVPDKKSSRQRISGVTFRDIDSADLPGKVQRLSTSTLQKINDRQFTAHLRFQIATKYQRTFDPDEARYIVGVDRGRNQLAYAALYDCDEDHVLDWYNRSGDQVEHYMNQFSKRIREFKKAGVWNQMDDARKRRQRYKRQVDYEVANSIVEFARNAPGSVVIVLEELSEIHRLGKYRAEKRRFNEWSYSRLQEFIEEKSDVYDIPVMKIEPYYTSQECSRCGEDEETSRQSVYFKCNKCEYNQHADANAAVNVAKFFVANQ
ncbi:transposase [Halorubrum laminariae]|uniref:Zinc ribbon domain-containing protein n=1 Tax=Halorubrum laminariae TaxID=1433523 RepID=A0ABD6C1Q3_9EURY|nr:transposase [Halorubrum laminariae]